NSSARKRRKPIPRGFDLQERSMLFRDRGEAGRDLARRLRKYADREDTFVLALPRGGVPVGFQIAQALHLPLDVFVVRKLGVPGQPELAIGAIASGGVRVVNEDVTHALGVPSEILDEVAAQEQVELARRERSFRGERAAPSVQDHVVILVDDGLATGSTMKAAVQALRQQEPGRIVVAVPVGAAETCDELRRLADEVICAETPEPFLAVGYWYDD